MKAGRSFASVLTSFLLLLVTTFIAECAGGETCTYRSGSYHYRTKYCEEGCCDDGCCHSVGLVIGLCVGGAILLGVCILVLVCCYRRRRSRGVVYRQNSGTTIVTTTSGGTVLTTSGIAPGYAYPPTYPSPQMPGQYPAYAPGQPLATGTAAPPPPYSTVTGGVANPTVPDTKQP